MQTEPFGPGISNLVGSPITDCEAQADLNTLWERVDELSAQELRALLRLFILFHQPETESPAPGYLTARETLMLCMWRELMAARADSKAGVSL